jgi:hypothetical protein
MEALSNGKGDHHPHYHQPLQYLQAQSKLQQTRHYKWMGFLQQFHLIIKYKKGNTNKLENMLSRPPTSKITTLGTLMHMEPFTHDAYKEAYTKDEDFKEVFQQLQGQVHVEEAYQRGSHLQSCRAFWCWEDSCQLTKVCVLA